MRTTTSALAAGALFAMAAAAQEAPAPAVVVAPVLFEDLERSVVYNGRLEADARVDLRARVGGVLEEVAFAPGDAVAEGDVLFRIDDDLYAVAVTEAEGALRSAEAVRLTAELERDRQAELVERDVASQAVLDGAEAAFGNAAGAAMRAEAALEAARLNLSYTRIAAPFAGRVGVASVDAGALVGPETPLVTLTRLDPIHAVFSVPTAAFRDYAARVRAGEAAAEGSVALTLADGRTYNLGGDLDFIDSAVAGGTDSIELRARFENPEGDLRDGELVRVTLTAGSAAPVLTVAQRAVQRDVQGAYVFVVGQGEVVERRAVDVDRTVGGRAILASGVEEGERVVTEGLNKVRPGVVVDAATEAAGG